MRSQIDRQMASKFCRQADACQEIWPLYDGKYASKMRADHFGIGSYSAFCAELVPFQEESPKPTWSLFENSETRSVLAGNGALGVKNPRKAAAFPALFSLNPLISDQTSCISPVFKQTLARLFHTERGLPWAKKTAFSTFQAGLIPQSQIPARRCPPCPPRRSQPPAGRRSPRSE